MDGTWLAKAQLQLLNSRFHAIEVMCHPYYFDESEYEFLSRSANVFEQQHFVELVGYADI
jgi:hypothetical protein